MWLKSLDISNFRSCAATRLVFDPTLTVLVGENNSGKSNIMDALRLATPPASGRVSRYFEKDDDLPYWAPLSAIEIRNTYDGLTETQKGLFTTALNEASSEAVYTTRFRLDESARRGQRLERLAGPLATPDVEPDIRNTLCHVFVEPLRDAQRVLDSAYGGRLALILESLTSTEDRDDFVKQAQTGLDGLAQHKAIATVRKRMASQLADLTRPLREQQLDIRTATQSLRRLTGSLRMKMAETGLDPADVASSGLGYANLLYLSSVVLELEHASRNELTLFLVEEPEAHLHPQLQRVLLDFLTDAATRSQSNVDEDEPAGRIQVVVTTHSPNIASAVSTSKIVVAKSQRLKPQAQHDPDAPTPEEPSDQPTYQHTVCMALRDITLSPMERNKIDRYLDVTRAELLFGRRFLLVEGISEALIIDAIAARLLDAETWRNDWRGVTIASVDSVDFAPYIRLLLAPCDGVRLADQVTVITDGDPKLDNNDAIGALDSRAETLKALAVELGAEGQLDVTQGSLTLEADLVSSGNTQLVRDAFLDQHPESAGKWTGLVGSDNASTARNLYVTLRRSRVRIQKGEFAHSIAAKLADAQVSFIAPKYIADAVTSLVKPHEQAATKAPTDGAS